MIKNSNYLLFDIEFDCVNQYPSYPSYSSYPSYPSYLSYPYNLLERFQEERFDKQNNLIKKVKLFQLDKIKKTYKTEPLDLVFTENKTYFENYNKDENTYQFEIHPIVHYKYSSLLEFPVKTYYLTII